MSTFTVKNEAGYNDWDTAQPVVSNVGLSLKSNASDGLISLLTAQGHGCMAHDPDGDGCSDLTWRGDKLDAYPDDLAAFVQAPGLRGANYVGETTRDSRVANHNGESRTQWARHRKLA